MGRTGIMAPSDPRRLWHTRARPGAGHSVGKLSPTSPGHQTAQKTIGIWAGIVQLLNWNIETAKDFTCNMKIYIDLSKRMSSKWWLVDGEDWGNRDPEWVDKGSSHLYQLGGKGPLCSQACEPTMGWRFRVSHKQVEKWFQDGTEFFHYSSQLT